MATPRADSTLAERVKKLEQDFRRIRLVPSTTQTDVAPLAAVKGAVWIDSSAGNEPKVFDGTGWVPARDQTIAVAQDTATAAQDAVTPLVPLTDVAAVTTGTTITGTTQASAGSGARVVINDPAYPGQIVLYTDDPAEIEPARLFPVVSGDSAYMSIRGPKVTGMTGIPASFDLIADTTVAERQSQLDVDRYHLFSSDTTIDGFTRIRLGDGTDYVTVTGKVVTNADLSSSTNVFPTNPYWYGFLNANQSIPNVTSTTVTGWVADGSPNSSGITHSSGVFTVPTAGRYRLRAHLWWGAQASPAGTRTASWISVSPNVALASDATPPSALAATPNYVEKTVRLTAGQQVFVQLTQTQGGAVNLVGTGADITYAQIEWVGP